MGGRPSREVRGLLGHGELATPCGTVEREGYSLGIDAQHTLESAAIAAQPVERRI